MINKAKSDGAEEVVILTVSGPLSGTRASAEQAKEMVDIPVHVHDSRSAGMGLGWQVIAAARAREAGGDAQSMVDAAEKVRTHMAMILAVDTLDFLHKGGRIGGAAKLIGSIINLKPQLIIDRETGLVEPGERTRTRKKAIQSMWDAYFAAMDTSKPMHIAVHHAAAPLEAEELMERIKKEYSPKELWLTELTPVLGTHGGPGTLAMTGYYEPD
jgi:DegV family protein with EDD domain